jgi:hypothetical protein
MASCNGRTEAIWKEIFKNPDGYKVKFLGGGVPY